MIRNEVKVTKEEEIKNIHFYYFDNIKGVKNILIDSKNISHQVDLLNEILFQLFNMDKYFEKEKEEYHWDQLKDYLGDVFDFEEKNENHEINVIISGYLDIVDSFIGNTYDYESIIEMFEVISKNYECGLGYNEVPTSLNFYIFEENIDLLNLKKEMSKVSEFDYCRNLKKN